MVYIEINGKALSLDDAFQQAVGLLQQERFAEMSELCRTIVALAPDHFRAQHGVGLGLHRLGRSAEALPFIREALRINPSYFEAHVNLGNVLRESGLLEEALESYLRAESLRPDAPVAHYNIANALADLGRPEEALERYSRALALDPRYLDALMARARALEMLGEREKACADYRQALALHPDHARAAYYLGLNLEELGLREEGLSWYRKATSLDPGLYDGWLALGNMLSAAVEKLDPSGLEEAVACYRRALSLQENGSTRGRLGSMLLRRGELDAALQEYRRALEHSPELMDVNSCYLMALQYHPAPTLSELCAESALWHTRFAAGVPKRGGHPNERDPERTLRVGYVSADFKRHPVGFHLMPALYHHSEGFELYCYSNSRHADFYTERLRSYAEHWREIAGLGDQEVQEMVAADQIDVLVDLSGHTAGNRLLLFAGKPAPVQVSWLGYFFSTGMQEIDYIIMDDNAVLPGEERFFSEEVWRLPSTRFCYEPVVYAPDVAPLPACENGCITFGSFNNLAKLTPQVVRLWARVLAAVPDARLLIKSAAFCGEEARELFRQRFAAEGIAPDRLMLRGQSEHKDMLAEYGELDIALDPFPFNGGITSCEALWMGVPVLTLSGGRPIARQTASFLKTMELTGFIAQSEEEYLALAARWAHDLCGLAEIRRGMRRRMRESLLGDGKRFTANMEAAYREMWRRWCAS